MANENSIPEEKKAPYLAAVSQVFTPGAPVDRYDLFAGRSEQVVEVVNAISQRGQHVILFGERGVGKTSLANVLASVVQAVASSPAPAVRINCDRSDDFTSIWTKVLNNLQLAIPQKSPVGFDTKPGTKQVVLSGLLSDEPGPDEIRILLSRYGNGSIIIMDEFDRINDETTVGLVADTIKSLSDHSVNATLVIVGVADSVNGLINEHESIERALVQVRMPRMSSDELREIVHKGLPKVGMTIDEKALEEIVRLSLGLPHYTHLLALHSAQNAVGRLSLHVEQSDVQSAVERAVTKAQQSIVNSYHTATASPRKENLFEEVLLACALAPTDILGYFAAADVREPLGRITGRSHTISSFSRHLDDFSNERRGSVLIKTGAPRKWRYRFKNPMMQPYILMHGRANDLLEKDMIPPDASQLRLELG